MQPPYPLHESVRDKLHPEYVAVYNSHITNLQQVQYQPLDVSRSSGTLLPGAGPKLPVGRTEDVHIRRTETDGPDVAVRCFTPVGSQPERGWPVLVYFHGGGWVLGNIDTENVVCTNICNRARCVVVNVDYRLAPENPFPAAVHDAWEALLWVRNEGRTRLNLDSSRVGVGGSSAGGNLSAVLAHRNAARGLPPLSVQLLNVPVMDNTANPANNSSWRDYEYTPALPATKMMWFRHHYLPDEKDCANPEASPLLYPEAAPWSVLPPAVIIVGELDVLREEGEQYAAKLKHAGVACELHVMPGMPHPFLAMDGVLEAGKLAVTLLVEGCQKAFSD